MAVGAQSSVSFDSNSVSYSFGALPSFPGHVEGLVFPKVVIDSLSLSPVYSLFSAY